jgi:hypothetical protein
VFFLAWQAGPFISNELIEFDPPEHSLPLTNKPLVFSVNIINITNFCVSYNIYVPCRDVVGTYATHPASAVMPPGSTQRIIVKMTPNKKELEDVQYKDEFTIYSRLVRESVEASDFVDRIYYEVGKKFPIVYTTKKVISLIMQ